MRYKGAENDIKKGKVADSLICVLKKKENLFILNGKKSLPSLPKSIEMVSTGNNEFIG